MMMHEFIAGNREKILSRTLHSLQASYPDRPSGELVDDVGPFLDQVVGVLRGQEAGASKEALLADFGLPESQVHGSLRKEQGFDVARIVRDYGIVCDTIHELAGESHEHFDVEEYQMLNRCIDEATALAVEAFAHASQKEESLLLGSIGHEIRNAAWSAGMAFDMIKSGKVAASGRTADVLQRSLQRIESLSGHALDAAEMADVSVARREWLDLRRFLQQQVEEAVRERGIQLELVVQPDLEVEADPRLLTAAVGNLIQNAIKFTHDAGVVFIHGRAVDEAILIEVEDRCGGLSPAAKEHMFDPPERRARDPRSRGFGLTIARRAVEGTGGSLRVGDLPGVGCVFTITLPRTQRNLKA